jgi:meso-butanediol dehydrogenase/(S,S)-butanediol dehydrogenase/diacetyl reductase
MSGRVQDRVVIVTGAARGIGEAICRAVAAEGAKVVVADLDAAGAGAVATSIEDAGDSAISVGVDVTSRDQVRAMLDTAAEAFGEVNVIFNNAGMNEGRDFLEVDRENYDRVLDVNCWGVVVCVQEAAKRMIAQGKGGKIVNTGSIAGRQGYWDFVPYSIAKFGVVAITQAAARGLAQHGITVTAFAPGVVDTPLWDSLDADLRAFHDEFKEEGDVMRAFVGNILAGRAATPADIAAFAVYLASPESDYMTGQMYMVDGGMVLV